MEDETTERRLLVLMVLLALWLAAWGYSVYVLFSVPDMLSTPVAHMKQTVGFLGWQGVAGVFAFGCWGVGWSLPKGSGVRRISVLPLWVVLGFVVAMGGLAAFGSGV